MYIITGARGNVGNAIARNYVNAVKANHLTYVLLLSSIGAHLCNGAGVVDGLGDMEEYFSELKKVNVLKLRPSYFMDNVFGQVHYKVLIHLPKDIPFNTNNVFVVMTDGNNKMVASPQLLWYGKVFYGFYESSSVVGTRVVQLINTEGFTTELFHSSPDIQNGKYAVPGTYLFNLYVEFQKPGKGEK